MNFANSVSQQEAATGILPSNKTQSISSFVTATTVTVRNPQTVTNATSSDAVIAVKCTNDSAYVAEFFAAGQQKIMAAASIGAAGDGTTCTLVVIRGRE